MVYSGFTILAFIAYHIAHFTLNVTGTEITVDGGLRRLCRRPDLDAITGLQFIELTVFGVGEAPFGLCSSPTRKGSFATTVRAVGSVTNALHHTDRGGVLIGCRRRGDKTWIQVWDTGIGIPADKLALLFTPPDNPASLARQKNHHANMVRPGLGLAIVRQIAGLLDYRLDAASTPGHGSVFAVEVPVACTQSTAHGRKRVSEEEKAYEADGITVLLVDNDTAILDACHNVVTASGHRLECARSRAEALEQVRRGVRPDVIICDLRLRQYPGTTIIHHLREALGQEVPAILLTGDTSFTETDMQDLPGCRLLYKPVEFELLHRVINEMVAA